MKTILILILILVAGFGLWVRVAPFDAADWHVDPRSAPEPGRKGHRESFVTDLPPELALDRIARIASATPRTVWFAGSPQEGRISFITRTRLWRFPDVTTISAVPEGEGSRMTLYARLRFGGGDSGVNRSRVEDWIRRFRAR